MSAARHLELAIAIAVILACVPSVATGWTAAPALPVAQQYSAN